MLNLNLSNEQEAKDYSLKKLTRPLSLEEIDQKIQDYEGYASNENSEDERQYWEKQIEELNKLKLEEYYQKGYYPTGIDELLLEVIEWRSMIFAFQNLEESNESLVQYSFLSQWYLGGTYAIFTMLGKLLSNDNRDNSLRNLWKSVSPYFQEFEGFDENEFSFLDELFVGKGNLFSNQNSVAMRYRNKVIAHNEHNLRYSWNEIENDLQIISRIWSLLVMWSSSGIMTPFRHRTQVFRGLEGMFSENQMRQLVVTRQVYLDRFENWCCESANHKRKISRRTPFVKTSFSFE